MGILQDITRLNDAHVSGNLDAFTIRSSSVEGAGMACYAARDLRNDEVILRVEKPIASVITSSFRKEVCSWCYSYDYGAIHKFKVITNKGRGIGWFCQNKCRDAWVSFIRDVGWEVIVAFEDGMARTKVEEESERKDEPCDVNQFETLWMEASQYAQKILTARRAKPLHQPKTATLSADVDIDDARFILSALISFEKDPSSLQEVLRLTPNFTPYLTSKNTILDHISIYHYLLSVLPMNSPLIKLVTPAHIVAIITRDTGNSWGIWDQTLGGQELFAYCMYPSASYFNHSCEPNVVKERVGRVYEFRIKGDVSKGSELNVSYLGGAEATQDVTERRKRLLESWYFECQCTKCTRESIVA